MPNTGHVWSSKELQWLSARWSEKPVSVTEEKYSDALSKETGGKITAAAIRGKARRMSSTPISQSTYPVYDTPLVMEGDAVVMTDIEFPFHNADFVNRVLELADAWGVKQLILGGDALHFESLSGWEPSWTNGEEAGGLSESQADLFYEFLRTLKPKDRAAGEELVGQIGSAKDKDGASTELRIAGAELRKLERQFDKIDFVLGNHEGRLLRAIETALDPNELMKLLELRGGKWRISPYYYSVLYSGGEKFQIEHPKNTAKFSAWKLAAKYQCHTIMGHSHQLNFAFDISGKYYAIECGHCVDEARLPYAAQRHNTGYAHILGAVIVREGYPHLLHQHTRWNEMKKMA